MDTVTTLPRSRPLTRQELAQMPDDGHRYELVDGTLFVTPAPSHAHQSVLGQLYLRLVQACPAELKVLFAPFDVALGDDTVLQPDLLVARRTSLTHRDLPTAPLLAVEVLSPSTALIDLNLKKARFEVAGCASYWVVDPLAPSLRAWNLQDGEYAEVANVTRDETFTAAVPFTVTFTVADLQD